jgi:hypothetical protein
VVVHEALRPALSTSREVHSEVFGVRRTIAPQFGNCAGAVQEQKGSKMLQKLLAAAAMAAIAYAVVPANAAKQGVGCSGPNLAKAETMIETMAEGEGKIVAQKEVALAQDAMLSGKMGACGTHLGKAMQAGAVK